jgi:hypothetical protein
VIGHHASHSLLRFSPQGIDRLNYDDPIAVAVEIPATWWLEHKSCKYVLSLLVHKDNKDISTKPTMLPPGPTLKMVREKSKQIIMEERTAAKLNHPVEDVCADGLARTENLGDVERDTKRAQVDGMRSVIEKHRVDSI